METYIVLYTIFTVRIVSLGSATVVDHEPCFFWKVAQSNLVLTCDILNPSFTTTIFEGDNKKHAQCIPQKRCSADVRNGHIQLNERTQMIYSVPLVQKYSNSVWTCRNGDVERTTTVSVINVTGISKSTAVYLTGTYVNDKSIKIKCRTCRNPSRFNAEFLLDGESIATVSYNRNTGKCFIGSTECTDNKCKCANSGKEFVLYLLTSKHRNIKNISCHFDYEDKSVSARFSVTATMSRKGEDFKLMDLKIRITKQGESIYFDKGAPVNKEMQIHVPLVSGVLSVFGVISVVFIYKRRDKSVTTETDGADELFFNGINDAIVEEELRYNAC